MENTFSVKMIFHFYHSTDEVCRMALDNMR